MKRRVLIVDDVADIRLMLRYMIEKEDYVIVAEAANGVEAVEKYRQHMPDITVMDIEMPFKTGIEAAREIMELSSDAHIIFCSAGVSRDQVATDALAMEGHTLIRKPFLPAQLFQAMNM
jgi:two-component system, chemotaxis family, chemotaxis protein CheY